MADSTIASGQTVVGSGDPLDTFAFTVAKNNRLILQLNGVTPVNSGVWLVDANGNKVKPGLLAVCGVGWGIHLFSYAGTGHGIIEITNTSGGQYTITLRPYSFWAGDDIRLKLHPGKCNAAHVAMVMAHR